MGCEFSRVSKEGEGGPGNGPLAPVDVWRGEDVHVDVAGRGRKRLPQGIAVPPSIHKALFQRAVREVMDNLWRVKGFVFKNDTYPPKTPAPTGGGGGGPAASPGSLVPAGMDVRHSGSERPPKGVGWQKLPRQGGESVGGTGAGAIEAGRTYLKPDQRAPEGIQEETGPRGGRYYESEGAAWSDIPVYHGTTPEDAEAIEKMGFGDKPVRWPASNTGLGFFFTNSRDEAYEFATKYGEEVGDIVEAEVTLKNPLVVDSWEYLTGFIEGETGVAATDVDGSLANQTLQKNGYDGVIFNLYRRRWVVAFGADMINVKGILELANSEKVRLYLVYPAGLRR